MKKFNLTTLLLLFLVWNLSAQEQLLLQEDFNNGFPQNWNSNSFFGNNQWVIHPPGQNTLDGSDMMYIQSLPNQQSITELLLPPLPAPDPGIDVLGFFFTYNFLSQQNSQLKVVQFDDQNPNIPIELEVLQLPPCDPLMPWSCGPDYFDLFVPIPNFDPQDQFALVFEDFDMSGGDFFAVDNFFLLGFNNCVLGIFLEENFPPTCRDGNDASLQVRADLGVPPYQYSIDGGPNQGNGQFLTSPGMHTVTVVDAIGCVKTFTIEVPNAEGMGLQTAVTGPTCFNGTDAQLNATAEGGRPPYSYSLDAGPGMANGNFNTSPGMHTIKVTDADDCMQSFTVTVPNTPDIEVNLVHTNTLLCFGDSDGTATATVTSGGMAPFTYSLDGGAAQNNGTFNDLAAGAHAIVITDAKGCKKTLNFTILEPAQLTLTTTGTDPSCFGFSNGTITITANGGTPNYNYGIDGDGSVNQASNVFDGLPEGEYFPIVEDMNGCVAEIGRFLDQPDPLISDTVAVTPSSGNDGAIDVETDGGSPAYVYLWSNGESTQDLEDLAAGEYWLVTTDQHLCPSDTLFVTVPLMTSIAELSAKDLKMLGNPVQDHIRLQVPDHFQSQSPVEIELVDTNGRLHLAKTIVLRESILNIALPPLASGSYFLKIKYQQQQFYKQVVKY